MEIFILRIDGDFRHKTYHFPHTKSRTINEETESFNKSNGSVAQRRKFAECARQNRG